MNPRDHRQQKVGLRPSTRRQIRREIYLPLLFAVLLIAGLAIFLWPEDSNPGIFADVSVVCLALPILLFGVLAVVILGFAVFATEKLIRLLPAPFRKAYRFLERLERTAKHSGDLAAKPMISTLSAWAGIKAFFHGVASIFRSDEGNLYE
jgi:hypothetical protein